MTAAALVYFYRNCNTPSLFLLYSSTKIQSCESVIITEWNLITQVCSAFTVVTMPLNTILTARSKPNQYKHIKNADVNINILNLTFHLYLGKNVNLLNIIWMVLKQYPSWKKCHSSGHTNIASRTFVNWTGLWWRHISDTQMKWRTIKTA